MSCLTRYNAWQSVGARCGTGRPRALSMLLDVPGLIWGRLQIFMVKTRDDRGRDRMAWTWVYTCRSAASRRPERVDGDAYPTRRQAQRAAEGFMHERHPGWCAAGEGAQPRGRP